MNKAARTAFLKSDKWATFRAKLLKERNSTCSLCGQKYYGRNKKYIHVHHLHPAVYDDLDPDKFALLCKPCHKFWHRILKRMTSKKFPIRNRGLWSLMRTAITPPTLDNMNDSLDLNQENCSSGCF